ncbi:phosphatase PAP2 family protein [uncultured Sphingomonas sp.]|uniref:phosphatase PAP2 family protein n=1 Tax=uncultured Sphingomonas sp. TaxID=158754 RepID=UPI0025852B16|nr:phosphatase PAP2 family protein [uncultured Sphingomonas sp.]
MGGKAKKKAQRLAKAEHRAERPLLAMASTPLIRMLSPAAKAADEPQLLALGIGTFALGTVLRRPTMARSGARMVASHLVATGLKTALKAAVDRPRPTAAATGGATLRKGHGTADTARNAFPSGHTAGAVAVAQAAAHEAPRIATPARLAAGALQVPRGAHYLTDVAVGAAIGWLSERLAGWAVGTAERYVAGRAARADDKAALAEVEAHPS